jgi:formate hydrogenlyase subunit 6/NADH:ubiquinone oxidoreductase subunit I
MEACPFDCIYPKEDVSSAKPLFFIDAEQCNDCGACALVCPESAIAPAAEFGHYGGAAARTNHTSREQHIRVAPAVGPPVQMATWQMILNEWIVAFVASHV